MNNKKTHACPRARYRVILTDLSSLACYITLASRDNVIYPSNFLPFPDLKECEWMDE